MLNFRKLKHDLPPSIVKEGKTLFDKKMVESVKISKLKADSVRFSCRVMGSFNNYYASELEIDRNESVILESDCDCTYKFDCQHLAAVLFHLEAHYNEILVAYSKETDLEELNTADDTEKEHLLQTLQEAETKEHARQDKKCQKELLQEYINASQLLGRSSFFRPEEEITRDKAELAVIFAVPSGKASGEATHIDMQLALRLPSRSKSLIISQIKTFLDGVRYNEAVYIGSKRYFFSLSSFDEASTSILKVLIDSAHFQDIKGEKQQRIATLDIETFGSMLAAVYDIAEKQFAGRALIAQEDSRIISLPGLYCGSIEETLKVSSHPAVLRFELHYLEIPAPKILLKPCIVLQGNTVAACEDVVLLKCAIPGMLYNNTYYRFAPNIRRQHLLNLEAIRNMTIPEPLFGTFVENALGELIRFAEVTNKDVIERFVTLPFVEKVEAECDIHYLNGELEASLSFRYGSIKVPSASSQLGVDDVLSFITPQGILARNLTEEHKIIDQLFQDFIYDPVQGIYVTKNDKKIVEFMTEIIPAYQNRITFNCPENLLDQFIYDDTRFSLSLRETNRVDMYEVEVKVAGYLNGLTVDLLWDCLSSKRAFVELSPKTTGRRKAKAEEPKQQHKILVLDLDKLSHIVQFLDEMGINRLDDHVEQRPLWSLASLDLLQFQGLPVTITVTPRLKEIQQQMLGNVPYSAQEVPEVIRASLRNYQIDGVQWLDRLRNMHLNGILADDMGLGKTLQAIIAITQYTMQHKKSQSIIVCPTSLVYNWKEEFSKFNPSLKILPIDGNPNQRKKLLGEMKKYDVIITSYTLLQKDIEFYKTVSFGYAILDEAQHIKNRGTRNAQSTKMIHAAHRLILTGTPIENSLDELWSLFDFLMPGLLSSYDRFTEKYIRHTGSAGKNLENLKRKVAPFILRRMKKDVLEDLPPVSEIVYHCHLSEVQQELYRSYAASAREELSRLVKKEGFDRVQIHVLATLTRLKQICCHPAIFAKDKAECGDSSKYEMLLELLQTLMEGQHKTVIFSQYTRMLSIIREDLQKQGIRYEYLDGSSKNRLSIVKKFNEDHNIPIFLVSLKAGGSGLNLVGADTVIHYDMWWNPAVENQATDRVHRLGQKNSVSAYKLITLNTIEEKILELHGRKKGLVKEVISLDEDMMSKLTWEEVLELLKA